MRSWPVSYELQLTSLRLLGRFHFLHVFHQFFILLSQLLVLSVLLEHVVAGFFFDCDELSLLLFHLLELALKLAQRLLTVVELLVDLVDLKLLRLDLGFRLFFSLKLV